MRPAQSMLKSLPLFFVIAIDSMGLGILFPILSDLLINHDSLFLAHNTNNFTREWLYGITIGVYMITWFFGSAMLGDLSDTMGRKKSLLICLIGAAVGYFISAISIGCHSLTLLIIGRVIAGFTAGSQPIAQAAIVDVSTDDTRARNIGYVLLAVSLGFVLGPFMGGILSDGHLISWFNYATPLYFAAVFSLINCALLKMTYVDSFIKTKKVKIRFHYALQIFKEAFQNERIRMLSFVLLVETVGWSEYFTFISQLLLRRFDYSVQEISFFISVLAIGFSIGFGLLVGPVSKRFDLKKSVIVNLWIALVLCFLSATTHIAILLWCAALLMGLSVSLLYSLLITLFSNQVNSDEQGWVMGITNSVSALSFGITALVSGFAANFSPAMPMYLGCVGYAIAAFILMMTRLR